MGTIAKQLQLNPSARESYVLFTFGSNNPKQICNPLVTIYLKVNKGRNLTITGSVVPKISGEILRSPLDKTSIMKLEEYKLEDIPPLQDESSEIGFLILNDHYEEILMSGKLEIDKSLYVFVSKIGLSLSGQTNTKLEPNYAVKVL